MKKIFFMIGRICLSLVFICTLTNHLLNWDLAEQNFDASLSHWVVYPGLPDPIQEFFNFLLSHSSLVMIVGAIFIGIGGLMVLLGFKYRLGAVLLILALIPATIIMHPFWMMEPALREIQMEQFLKNLGLLGGLLILASCKSGGGE